MNAEMLLERQVQELLRQFDCQHFYIDMGTNIGVQIRKLYEPDKYPEAEVLSIFESVFGRDRCKVCSIGFEPNIRHAERHRELQTTLRSAGAGVLVVSGAVGSQTGSTEFLLGGYTSSDMDVGGSINAAHNMKNKNTERNRVQVVNIPNLLVRIHRHLVAQGGGERKGKIMAKTDIEGTEYELLPSLVLSQTFCLIDYLFAEWHGYKYSNKILEGVASQNDITSERSGAELYKRMLSVIEEQFKNQTTSTGTCQTQIVAVDDETYLKDGLPFPTSTVCVNKF